MISSYSELQSAIGRWLARSDLATEIPNFIQLGEKAIGRRLRKKVVNEPITLTGAVVALPAAAVEVRMLRLNHGSYQGELRNVTTAGLGDYRTGAASGLPRAFAIVDRNIIFAPAPDAAYTAEIEYYEKLVPLSDAASVNSTLTDSPDVYLYAALVQAEPYLEHDERTALWLGRFEDEILHENIARERAELGATPQPIRLPFVIG